MIRSGAELATMELAFFVAMIVVAKLKTKEVEVLYTPLLKSKVRVEKEKKGP
ncbi:hypothetical protein [Enterovibrio norvegicus]|uniref:hypothetical protein n=1 Tax=Enterovibrio norvegicus TaxID=188144 RepID=UPI001304213A|nr:hypothetical protein [Enterovibrio norvegicus]